MSRAPDSSGTRLPDTTPLPNFSLGFLKSSQHEEAASIIHRSLVTYYEKHLNQGERFGQDWRPFMIFPELYEALDPGCAVSACGPDGKLLGVCFYHPRETHVSVGIVATDPGSGGRGVARAMVAEVLRLADEPGLPVRLVSSALNLDSFSLYTRLGFVPGMLFQDMQFPPGKLPSRTTGAAGRIRPATARDAAAMADLEHRLTGIRRQKDYDYFLQPSITEWRSFVSEDAEGRLLGFLFAIRSGGGTHLVGPGVMEDEETALELLAAQLHDQPDSRPVFLVPAQCAWLISRLYAEGARNVELHLAQLRPAGKLQAQQPRPEAVKALAPSSRTTEPKNSTAPDSRPPRAGSVVIPTFLPESG